mgnify:CR=1 FL=1
MKQIIYNVIIILCSVCFWSCEVDEDALSNKGYLSFAIGQDISVTTKAEDYNPELLALKISDSTRKEIKTETGSVEELNALKIELVAGEYTVEVYSNNYDGNSAFGENGAYYYGSTKVSVTKGTTVTANITCTLANVKVTVNFDTQLVGQLGGKTITAQVTSKAQSVTARDFSSANTENKVAFFPVGDLNVAIAIMNGDTKEHDLTHAITEVKARDHYILNIKLQETGTENITVQVDPSMQEYSYEFTVSQKPTNQGLLSANAWATFAYLTAENVTSASGIDLSTLKIQYRQKDTEDWTTAETTVADNSYSATAMNLTPAKTYEYRLTGGLETPAFNINGGEFTTEEAIVLYNGGFDDWYKAGNGAWYAITEKDAQINGSDSDGNLYSFWDSGNVGASTIGTNPTQGDASMVYTQGEGKKSAKLASRFVGVPGLAGKFAAGNLYIGHYVETLGMDGAKINFGQQFEVRPTALKGYLHYTPGAIDYKGDNQPANTVEIGNTDINSIFIALTTEIYPIDNTNPKSGLFDKNDERVIAYGELPASECGTTNGQWKEFNIPLEYKSLTVKPKYIIIVCSASKYGDYFTGSTKSVMYLDDFELIYDGEPAIWK